MKKLAFTGGGSAGHVIPNLAIIDEILQNGEADICYFGGNGIEKNLAATRKLPYFEYECPKLIRGKSFSALKKNCAIPFKLRKAVKKAKEGLRAFQPDLLFSKGGYVALPAVLAAKKLKIPVLTHESDLSPGLTTKLIAKKCKKTLTSFPETAKRFKNGQFVGAPIRKELLYPRKTDAKREWDIPDNKTVVLIIGGGSGSEAINAAVRAVAPRMQHCFFLHAVGKGNLVQSNLKNYRQTEFIKDMGGAYSVADLIISRAGAGAIFEIIALKKPAVFIPLEGQTRGDQKENARYFFKKGLCRVLPQNRLANLQEEIEYALRDQTLKKSLIDSNVPVGNANILREIRALL